MIGFYNIDKLAIGQMIIINKLECIPIEKKLILSKIDGACNSWQYMYKEIFTKTEYRVLMNEKTENEMFVFKTEKLNDYLTKVELKTKIISRYRLLKIYNMINQENKNIKESKIKKLSLYDV